MSDSHITGKMGGGTGDKKKTILTKNTLMPAKVKRILTINVTPVFEVLKILLKRSLSQKRNCLIFLRKGT